jgi:hypothetical protein
MLRKLISPPHLAIALLALLCAGIAYAAAYTGTFAVVWRTPPYLKGGAFIGDTAAAETANRVTKMLAPAAQTVDIASTAATNCTDSSGITVAGAKTGDPCLVGQPSTPVGGAGVWSCYVSAADTVRLRFCNPTAAAIDPASAQFHFRIVSNQ